MPHAAAVRARCACIPGKTHIPRKHAAPLWSLPTLAAEPAARGDQPLRPAALLCAPRVARLRRAAPLPALPRPRPPADAAHALPDVRAAGVSALAEPCGSCPLSQRACANLACHAVALSFPLRCMCWAASTLLLLEPRVPRCNRLSRPCPAPPGVPLGDADLLGQGLPERAGGAPHSQRLLHPLHHGPGTRRAAGSGGRLGGRRRSLWWWQPLLRQRRAGGLHGWRDSRAWRAQRAGHAAVQGAATGLHAAPQVWLPAGGAAAPGTARFAGLLQQLLVARFAACTCTVQRAMPRYRRAQHALGKLKK